MENDRAALVAILGMALVTYATRVGGLWLVGRVRPSPAVEAWLRQVPGAILAAIVVPAALRGGPADGVALAAAMLVAARTRSLLLALAIGVGVAWVLRRLM